MLDDDEILDELEPARTSNRGFWLVIVALLTMSALLVGAIFANRPLVNAISGAESQLRHARSLADDEYAQGGTYTAADATSLSLADSGLNYVPGDVPSSGLGSVSVFATDSVWAAAVQARPHACFYIKREAGAGIRYGSGITCTGRAAVRGATSGGW